jgi:hypothetical protein
MGCEGVDPQGILHLRIREFLSHDHPTKIKQERAGVTKAAKAAYDKLYRAKNFKRIQANHAAYFQRTYDPAEAAKTRKLRMPRHVEYCRQPRYRRYKAAGAAVIPTGHAAIAQND